jgi:hypothetical protein
LSFEADVMAKKSSHPRSPSRAARRETDEDVDSDRAPESILETETEPEPRPARGRTDRRSSLARLGNIQYEEFMNMMKKDSKGVFELCEEVYREAVESIERLQEEHRKQQEESELAF